MDALRLLAVRHGETASSVERRFTGARDVALTPRGRAQAEALARVLAAEPVTAVYTSPLGRARETAEAIARPHGVDVRVDPRLREMAFGAWEGLTRAEVAAEFPGAMDRWTTAPHLATAPGGETLGEVERRTAAALAALRAAHPGATVVLVSHAIVVRLLVLAALGLGPERLWSVDASPAGLTELEYQGSWVTIHRMNTLAHLDAAEVATP